jgi:endonuclease/exonuclease/phosphatase family metal-dependent hydrolase
MDIAAARALRVMTLNCAHGARAPVPPIFVGRAAIARNLDAIGAAIDGVRPDVVALQEVDRGAFWSGRLDHVAAVASGARMPHFAFGAHEDAPRLGLHHGTAVLSRAPLHAPESMAFGTSPVDDKGWVKVTLAPEALGGRAVDVVSVHLDPFTPWARRRQIAMMAAALGPAHRERPLVVMGDMNAGWGRDGRGDVARLAEALGLHTWDPAHAGSMGEGTLEHDRAHVVPCYQHGTYPARRPWRRIDWILLSPELAFASYATVPAEVSDHRGVVADVVLTGTGR